MDNIPKIIHYCWFGGNPLPDLAVKCIESWKTYFPNYEIKEWNESNYDVHKITYTSQAYEAKKYAFVSDYARFDILYQYGGIYFDTDVEVIKSFDNVLENGSFMGLEKSVDKVLAVNPGLGMAAVPCMEIYKEIMSEYKNLKFLKEDGSLDKTTIVVHVTNILQQHGLEKIEGIQIVAGMHICPKDYFSPKDVDDKSLTITKNTYSIHHYDASWAEWYDKAAGERGPKLKRIFGNFLGNKINVVIYGLQKYGFIGCIRKIFHRDTWSNK